MRELEAFQRECERIEATLRDVQPPDWSRPALGEWDLRHLTVHLLRGTGRIAAYLDQPVTGEVEKDRVSYFRYDVATVAPSVVERTRREAQDLPAETLAEAFAQTWRETVRRATGLPGDRVMASPLGVVHLQEYTATRVLEAVVHHMDVRRALDLPPDPDPDAADIVVEILEGLLGEPRPRNLGRDRFILAATGRIPHDDARFPVLA